MAAFNRSLLLVLIALTGSRFHKLGTNLAGVLYMYLNDSASLSNCKYAFFPPEPPNPSTWYSTHCFEL